MNIIDSHTGGEPTRLILSGGPPLGSGALANRRKRFAREFDHYRSMAVSEPRGAEALVGALLCPPQDASCSAGAIFFNKAGYLDMCGHAAMGLAVSLHHLGEMPLGQHRLETPAGVVLIDLKTANEVTVENVPSYRHLRDVQIEVDGLGQVSGDVAWGGNWFFLAHACPVRLQAGNLPELTRAAMAIRRTLQQNAITGPGGEPVDHVEFFGPALSGLAQSRNFVLCPDDAYDRSPCGTGTSAKLACLAADGVLAPGEVWLQESITGSRFQASYRRNDHGRVTPSITGHAYVTAHGVLHRSPADPFANGITSRACSPQAAAR